MHFARGSVVVEDHNIPALICVADLMLENPQIKVGVEAQKGIELAAERAEAIVGWLVSQGGVSVSRLRTIGGGGHGGGGSEGGASSTSAEATGGAAVADGASGGAWHVRFNVIAEIKISDQLQFDGGSDALRDESKETLRQVAHVLQSRPDVKRLTVEGHTCSDGPLPYNEQLSRERAATVRAFLKDECGVAEARLTTVGHGPNKPITTQYTQRRTNRRVEFLCM